MSPEADRFAAGPFARLLLAAFLVSCTSEPPADDDAYAHVMSFDSAHVRLARQRDTLQLTLQLAVSDEQKKTMRLMERRHLGDYAGMLFVYDTTQPPDAGFWMYRTRIPLDIAFSTRPVSSAPYDR